MPGGEGGMPGMPGGFPGGFPGAGGPQTTGSNKDPKVDDVDWEPIFVLNNLCLCLKH